jgi:L-aspartate oxidase
LLEALVMADRAAERAGSDGIGLKSEAASPNPGSWRSEPGASDELVAGLRGRLQDRMWRSAGIVRTDAGLAEARRELLTLTSESEKLGGTVPGMELRNLLTASLMVVECALRRPESRGLHYNEDHPRPDGRYKRDTVISRSDEQVKAEVKAETGHEPFRISTST